MHSTNKCERLAIVAVAILLLGLAVLVVVCGYAIQLKSVALHNTGLLTTGAICLAATGITTYIAYRDRGFFITSLGIMTVQLALILVGVFMCLYTWAPRTIQLFESFFVVSRGVVIVGTIVLNIWLGVLRKYPHFLVVRRGRYPQHPNL